ncbi:MAG TPA: hypothetical protein GX526_03890 [Thermoanaerobacterales bacterium]|nr:hypothetical protein [Thermoanaerobacterales bacterium]
MEIKAKEVLMFWVFAISIFVNMSLVKGDIILNNAITMIAYQHISEVEWIKYMLVPTFIFCAIATVGFKFTFNNILKNYVRKGDIQPEKFESLSKEDKKHLALILAVVVLWATETIHGINGTIIVIIGTLIMYGIKLLGKQDIKSINIGLLIFLTAVFSIGAVMKESGIATIIFSNLIVLFPKTFSLKYVVIMAVVSIILHMILGSNITTMSVIIPGLMSISKGVANPTITMFTIFVSICAHFVLPYQHGVILIGEGSKYYTSKTTLKYAPVLTLLTILSILFVYLKWWKLMGLT